jgi:ribA/ribD-fused uncharacterized protein
MIAFFGGSSPLSNFHGAEFEIEGVRYLHVEQFFQAQKAKFYGDFVRTNKIMSSSTALQCLLARKHVKVQHQSQNTQWQLEAPKVMKKGLLAKFTQNKHLGNFLLSTGSKVLVEANAKDNFWGAGLSLNDANLADSTMWPGSNKLGILLGEVRDILN